MGKEFVLLSRIFTIETFNSHGLQNLVEDRKLWDLLKPLEQLSAIAALSHYHYRKKTLLWGFLVSEGCVLPHGSIYKPFCIQAILQWDFTDLAA